MMIGAAPKKRLTMEDYIAFFQDPDRPSLTMDQLNEIVSMHGFIRRRTKNETLELLNSVKLEDPARSTAAGSSVIYPCASLELEDVKEGIRTLGWEECPIGSILTVQSSPPAKSPRPAEKRKRNKKNTPAAAAPQPISCSSAMTAVTTNGKMKKKTRKRKAKNSKALVDV